MASPLPRHHKWGIPDTVPRARDQSPARTAGSSPRYTGHTREGARSPNGLGNEQLVNKLLHKLKESQDLFDHLESLFDHKVKELGTTEGELQKAASQISSLHNIIAGQQDDLRRSAERMVALESAVALSASPRRSPPPLVVPSTPRSTLPAESAILHEKIRQLQTDHAAQLRSQAEAAEMAFSARLQTEVASRTAKHTQVVDQLRSEAQALRDELSRQSLLHRDEIKALRDELAAARAEQMAKERSDSRYKEELHVHSAKLSAQQQELERARREIQEKTAEIERKDSSLQMATDMVAQLREQHNRTVDSVQELTAKNQSAAAELVRKSTSLTAANETILQLQESLARLKAASESLENSLREECEARRKAEGECLQYKDITDKMREDHGELRSQIAEIQAVIQTQSAEITQLQREKAALTTRCDELQQHHRTELAAKTKTFEQQLRKKERDHEMELAARVKQYESDLHLATLQKESEKDAVRHEKERELAQALREKEGEVAALQAKARELSEVRERLTHLEGNEAQLEDKVRSLTSKVLDKEREVALLTERTKSIDELTVKLNGSEMREVALEERLRESSLRLADRDREIASLSAKLRNIDEVRSRLSSSEARESTLQERERDAHDRLRQKDIEIAALQERIKQMDEIRSKLRDELTQYRVQNDALREKEEVGKERDRELAACKEEMSRATMELSRRAEELRKLQAVTNEVGTLRDECSKMSEVKAMLEAKEAKLEMASREVAKLQLLCSQKDDQYDALVQDYEVKEEECLRQAAVLDEAQQELQKLAQVRDDLQLAKAREAELQVLFEEREATLKARASELSSGCERITQAQQQLEGECAVLQGQLAESTRQIEHLTAMLSHKEFLLAEKEREVQDGEAKLSELRDWLHNKVQEATEEAARFREERDHALDQVNDQTSRLETVESERASMAMAAEELRGVVKQLRREIDDLRSAPPPVHAKISENLRQEMADLHKQLRQAEEDRYKADRAQRETETLLDAVQAKAQALQEEVDTFRSASPAAPRNPDSALQANYDKLFREYSALQSVLHKKEREVEREVECYKRELRRESENERKELQQQIEDYRKQLSEARAAGQRTAERSSSPLNVPSAAYETRATTPLNLPSVAFEQSFVVRTTSSPAVGGTEPPKSESLRPGDSSRHLEAERSHHPTPITHTSRPPTDAGDMSAFEDMPAPRPSAVKDDPLGTTVQSQVYESPPTPSQPPAPFSNTDEDTDPEPSLPILGLNVDFEQVADGHPKISAVKVGGPAYKAGVRTGDWLQMLDKRPVVTPGDVEKVLASHQAGDMLELTFARGRVGALTVFPTEVKLAVPRHSIISRRSSATGTPRLGSTVRGPRPRSASRGSSRNSSNASTPVSQSLRAPSTPTSKKWQ